MRYILVFLLLLGGAAAHEPVLGALVPFSDRIVCHEYESAKNLVTAYAKSNRIGNALFKYYNEKPNTGPRECERTSFQAFVKKELHSEQQVHDLVEQKVTILEIERVSRRGPVQGYKYVIDAEVLPGMAI